MLNKSLRFRRINITNWSVYEFTVNTMNISLYIIALLTIYAYTT